MPESVYRFRPDPRLPHFAVMAQSGRITGLQRQGAGGDRRHIQGHAPVWRPLDERLAQQTRHSPGAQDSQSAFSRGVQLAN
jgi:hypothetical protein